MILYSVKISPAAEQDIADAFSWYKVRNKTAADGFREEAFIAIDYVTSHPLSKPKNSEGDRKWVLKHFPYSVVYELTESTVTILAVAHHRRAPDYWRDQSS